MSGAKEAKPVARANGHVYHDCFCAGVAPATAVWLIFEAWQNSLSEISRLGRRRYEVPYQNS